MFDSKDCFLQLTVYNNAVGNHQNGIEYVTVLRIMHRCKNMSKPGNRFRFSASRRMFNQIIAVRVIQNDIVHHTFHSAKLMETRENQFFGTDNLPRVGILPLFFLDVNEAFNQEENLIFRPNVLPHIRDIDSRFVVRISRAVFVSLVERIKKRIHALEVCREVHLVQIHGESGKNASAGFEKARFSIPLFFILSDSVVTVLTGCIAL